jgi:hypothetical protein
LSETVIPDMVKSIKKKLDSINDMKLSVSDIVEVYSTLNHVIEVLDLLSITYKPDKFK